jgi:hypothetical protein
LNSKVLHATQTDFPAPVWATKAQPGTLEHPPTVGLPIEQTVHAEESLQDKQPAISLLQFWHVR